MGTRTPVPGSVPPVDPCSPALATAALSGPHLRGPVSTLASPWLTPAGILGVGGSDLEKEWSGRALSECGQVTRLGVISHRAGPPRAGRGDSVLSSGVSGAGPAVSRLLLS